MSPWELGKPRIIAGRLHKPGLIEQFLAKPIEKNEGRELHDRLLRTLKAARDAFYDDEPMMLPLADINRLTEFPLADINRLIAIFEDDRNLNEAFGSTKPAHRETGSGNRGEVAAVIAHKLSEGKSVKQVGKELNRQVSDVRRIFWRNPGVISKTIVKHIATRVSARLADPSSPLALRRQNARHQAAKLRDQYLVRSRIIRLLADRGRASH